MAYLGKYDHPNEIVRDQNLTLEEKVSMLESWRNDKEAYMRATEDGMPGSSRSEFLRKIEDALISLRQNRTEQ